MYGYGRISDFHTVLKCLFVHLEMQNKVAKLAIALQGKLKLQEIKDKLYFVLWWLPSYSTSQGDAERSRFKLANV